MDVVTPDPDSRAPQLTALKAVADAARNGFGQPQRALLSAVQEVVFEIDEAFDPPEAISACDLAAGVGDPVEALQLIRLMVVMALADGPPSAAQMSLISGFASALDVHEPAVAAIGHLAKGNLRRFRLACMRHSHIRHYFRNTVRMSGSRLALLEALLIFRGVIEDRERAARYRALDQLPEDTLGHRFFRHCVENDLPFPGEKGGFPEGALFHDFTHVLTGCDTSPEGEMRNAAFQAGYTREDHDFFTWLFSLVLHTTGVNISPFPMEMVPGRIGQGRLAVEVLSELRRGSKMENDLGDQWDCWDYVQLPIDVARERLGVAPVPTPSSH